MTHRERFVRILLGQKVDRAPFIKLFGGTNATLPHWEVEYPGIGKCIDHVLRFEPEPRYFDMASLKPRLHFISGDLTAATFLNDGIELSYASGDTPCYAIINKRPGRITVDGVKTACSFDEADGAFVVKLPGGTHTAVIGVGGGFAHLVETSGVILFSIIIIFGGVTSILFLGLFVLIRIKRKFTRA
jgi:hypothetical protein